LKKEHVFSLREIGVELGVGFSAVGNRWHKMKSRVGQDNDWGLGLLNVICRPDPNVRAMCFVLTALAGQAWALPSAKSILDDCAKTLEVDCKTEHTVSKTTTVTSNAGDTPMTMVQVIEVFKKKPNKMKTIIDNGLTRLTTFCLGEYMYIQDPATKKYSPVKAPFKIDPFGKMNQTLSNFDSSEAKDNEDGTYTVTLRGGKLDETIDRTEVLVDSSRMVVTQVKVFGKDGVIGLVLSLVYENVGDHLQMKKMSLKNDTGSSGLVSETEIVEHQIDSTMDDSVFEVPE